jgi:multicomponent Na+:H+ antiporter subunit E
VSDTANAGAGHRLWHQVPLLLWLVLVWNLLWGTWSWANLLSGALVALGVTFLLPLPPVVGGSRVRPVALVRFLGHFVADLVRSGALVAWQTIRPQGIDRSAIISVQLRTDSDLLLTLVTQTLNLLPGSMVLDVDRASKSLLMHVLVVRDEGEVERQRADVLRVEERITRAFGSADEIATLRAPADPHPERAT